MFLCTNIFYPGLETLTVAYQVGSFSLSRGIYRSCIVVISVIDGSFQGAGFDNFLTAGSFRRACYCCFSLVSKHRRHLLVMTNMTTKANACNSTHCRLHANTFRRKQGYLVTNANIADPDQSVHPRLIHSTACVCLQLVWACIISMCSKVIKWYSLIPMLFPSLRS